MKKKSKVKKMTPVEQHLEDVAKTFTPFAKLMLDKSLLPEVRAVWLHGVMERLKEEGVQDVELASIVDIWQGLSDRAFRISDTMFWMQRC